MTVPLLSLASGVLPEHPAETLADAASAAGFAAFGVRIEPCEWSDRRAHDLARRAEDEGLLILDAEVLWIKAGKLPPDLFRLIDLAAIMGAKNLLAVSSDPDEGSTVEKFARLCDHARPIGIPVSLEFGRFTTVPDIHAARRILGAAARPNARLLVDPLHWSRSGGCVEDVASAPASLFAYAQLCDAGPDRPDPEDFNAIRAEALDGRLLPGEGVLPLRALLDALPPGLPLSIELRSRALRDRFPDPIARAAHLLERTLGWYRR
ncbi:hypothetical protein GCM10007897_11620 [Sphingobium jiangsuense]|uniref:Sugar phosphate isomerase/epimerase n=1 Tax=Sphingobium jiangsuense TaxID=870476 RepID=A0A7W6BJW6_9SPHN|nr:TIM barrel protein [Sphingobium jiangsuense]MBB3928400.1 sugar phosphate isomerase/epimerase [Sphingobium jiangsuense]GLS99779.1 hypothetical protein GCM10007897_11620 [Sphingobium jiangsuense]